MCIYRDYLRTILFKLDPEDSHNLAHKFIAEFLPIVDIFSRKFIYTKTDLQISIFGKTLSNPIGLAAGFDKNGDLVHSISHLGFGFAEIGSVSAQAHEGNPKPRLWRLPKDKALINWMGLNSEGAIAVSRKLATSKFSLPIAVNIVKSNKSEIKGRAAQEDLLFTFRTIRHLPLLYVVINISCVNTTEGILQETKMLSSFLKQVQKENSNNLPILIKLSEDASDDLIDQIVDIGNRFTVAGYLCGNTSRQRPPLKTAKAYVERIENGGLSGPPIKPLILPLCRKIYKQKLPIQIIIASGGITNGQDVYDYIRAGANLVQLYTALVYEGPSTVRKICEELSVLLKQDGLTLSQAIGLDCV